MDAPNNFAAWMPTCGGPEMGRKIVGRSQRCLEELPHRSIRPRKKDPSRAPHKPIRKPGGNRPVYQVVGFSACGDRSVIARCHSRKSARRLAKLYHSHQDGYSSLRVERL